MVLASDMPRSSGRWEGDVLCAGAGSGPGMVVSLWVSCHTGELWARRTLYLMLSLLFSEVLSLHPEQLH